MSIISELNKLIDAGFTKDDIARFYEANKTTPKSKDDPEPKPKDGPEPEPKPNTDMFNFDSLTSQMTEITKLLRSSNLIKDEQPKPRTIDDIFDSMFADERDEED